MKSTNGDLLKALHSARKKIAYVCLFILLVARQTNFFKSKRRVRDAKPLFLTYAKIGEHGRLGNQIFQLASTIGIAETNGVKWRFPERITDTAVGELFSLQGNLDDALAKTLAQHSEVAETFYDVRLYSDHGQPISLHGYFQWPQYFEHSMDTLRSHLRVNPELVYAVHSRYPGLSKQRNVAVHVRRGDHVKFQHIYNLLDWKYYIDALRHVEFEHVYIVSDDKEWCASELATRISTNVTISEFSNELLDFALLYMSDAIVISSSSFSWWAGFLKDVHSFSQNHIIVAPKYRYNPSGSHAYLNSRSYYPKSWRVIDT